MYCEDSKCGECEMCIHCKLEDEFSLGDIFKMEAKLRGRPKNANANKSLADLVFLDTNSNLRYKDTK